jgi:hypothetical protein
VIAAVVVSYKETEATHRCVASLLAARPRPALIVLVDNASPDDAADRHEAWLGTAPAGTAIAPGSARRGRRRPSCCCGAP